MGKKIKKIKLIFFFFFFGAEIPRQIIVKSASDAEIPLPRKNRGSKNDTILMTLECVYNIQVLLNIEEDSLTD